MIRCEQVSKAYASIQALDKVDLHVAPGKIVGLLGPNGAGKTTLIKILTGYLQPDEGTVAIDGLDVLTERMQVQARVGYLPENAPLYPELSVQRYLQLVADLRRIPAAQQRARLSDAIHATNLADRLTQPIGTLSKGYRQRVGLAQAILHRPRLLILDEPSVGLDPTQIVEMRNLIRRLSEQSTVLFSSHILSEVEALCDRVSIIRDGRTVESGSLAQLRHLTRTSVAATLQHPPTAAELATIPGVHDVVVDGPRVTLSADTERIGEVLRALGAHGIQALTSQPPTLEELFLRSYAS